MANRILRESICSSETIDSLSMLAENAFYRMLVCVDDYGRIDARPQMLRARMYPLKSAINDEDMLAVVDELETAGLIWIYAVDGKRYIQITTWEKYQTIRTKRSKYPEPPKGCEHLHANASRCSQTTAEAKQDENKPLQNVVLNPNPNPYPNPNPDAESVSDARVGQVQQQQREIMEQIAPLPAGFGGAYSASELMAEQEVQGTAEQYAKRYGLSYNQPTLDALAEDIRTHGPDTVRAALDQAAASDKRGGISLNFYRACLNNPAGGSGGAGKLHGAHHDGYIRMADDAWTRASEPAFVDIDALIDADKPGRGGG